MNDARRAFPARPARHSAIRVAPRLRRQVAAGVLLSTVSAGLLLAGSLPAHAALLGESGTVCGVTDGLLGGVLAPVGDLVAGCAAEAVPTSEPVPTPEPPADRSITTVSEVPVATSPLPAVMPAPEPAVSPTPALATFAPTHASESFVVQAPPAAVADPAVPAPAPAARAPAPAPGETPQTAGNEGSAQEPATDRETATETETDTSLVAVSPLPNGDDLSSARRAFGVGLLVAGVALVGLGGLGTVRRRQLAHATFVTPSRAATSAFNNTPWAGAGGR